MHTPYICVKVENIKFVLIDIKNGPFKFAKKLCPYNYKSSITSELLIYQHGNVFCSHLCSPHW